MGLNLTYLKLLLDESKRIPFSGSILTLGRMDIHFTKDELYETLKNHGLKPVSHEVRELSQKQEFFQKEYISDEFLFKSIGFDEVVSIDVSDYEHANIIFDLNAEITPRELQSRFDVVLDGGTSEHVFLFPNVLKHICKMLKIGGRVFHISPASNFLSHKYYMFSPDLFWDFYQANIFDVNELILIRQPSINETYPYRRYLPGLLPELNCLGLDDAAYLIYFSATKTNKSIHHAIPIQSEYQSGNQGKIKNALLQYMILIKNTGYRTVAFWGIGEFAKVAIETAIEAGLTISGLFDGNIEKQGTFVLNMCINAPEKDQIIESHPEVVFITPVVSHSASEIEAILNSYNLRANPKIVKLARELTTINRVE